MLVAPLPKRRETTFTSSGCETKSAIGLLPLSLLITLQHSIHLLLSKVLVEVVIHLRCGRPTASANALHFFQREQPIRRRFFVADAKFSLAVIEKFLSAAQHAGNVGADLHVV